ncbi:hypothetical protein ACLBVW_36455, partial [Pseudomonas aeruginosa]
PTAPFGSMAQRAPVALQNCLPLPDALDDIQVALMTVAADQGVRGLMQTVLQATKNGVEISSLTDLARPTRVEPLVIVAQN